MKDWLSWDNQFFLFLLVIRIMMIKRRGSTIIFLYYDVAHFILNTADIQPAHRANRRQIHVKRAKYLRKMALNVKTKTKESPFWCLYERKYAYFAYAKLHLTSLNIGCTRHNIQTSLALHSLARYLDLFVQASLASSALDLHLLCSAIWCIRSQLGDEPHYNK